MTTDKNGVDLNIGDEVIDDHSIGVWKIKSISKKNNVIYCRSEIYETCLSTKEVTKFIPAPVERTYTEAEIREAFTFSMFLSDTIRTKLTIELLLDRLNNPRP